jgi:hypothetical protein
LLGHLFLSLAAVHPFWLFCVIVTCDEKR